MGTRLTAGEPLKAVVTGGNRGLGLEIVRLILVNAPGSRVFLGCRNMDEGEKLAALFRDEGYLGEVTPVLLDVTSGESIGAARKTVGDCVPHLDLLVNNAGVLYEEWSPESARQTMRVNFEGVVAVTTAFLPLLLARPGGGGHVLSTSSGMGARTLGLLSDRDRQHLSSPALDVPTLRLFLNQLIDALESEAEHTYHSIPTVAYGVSKMGVNLYTQVLARTYPSLRANACSPGFTNTGMCAGYTGTRVPKDVPLGASVFTKVLFSDLGAGRSGTFFKEASKPGTSLVDAISVVDSWLQ